MSENFKVLKKMGMFFVCRPNMEEVRKKSYIWKFATKLIYTVNSTGI